MKKLLTTLLASCMLISATAQSVTTASSSMTASPWAVGVPYDITAQGKSHQFVSGMGGWSWDFFGYKQRNWVGQDNQGNNLLGVARVGFFGRNSTSSSVATSLSEEQISTGINWGTDGHHNGIDTELAAIAPTGAKKLLLLCDMDMRESLSESSWLGGWKGLSYTSAANAKRRINYYVNDIALAVQYIESKGYNVVAVAPFNEPDFDANGNCGKSAKAFNAVAEVMQSNATLKGRVFGPNTLNSTEAVNWYSTVKDNINFVNTHQLAGTSFDDLTKFWDQGVADGKYVMADEMHNVMEAMVAMNHGGENQGRPMYGTWWGYDGVARAEFSRMAAMGRQLAYKEDAPKWAVAGVYRYDSEANKAKAIIGTSERQAVATDFTFLSKGRLAYYDAHGPAYDYTEEVPGGAKGSYQNGQTNAERLINIYTGEDVPVEPVNGQYKIVNKASGKVLSLEGGNASARGNVYQWTDGGLANQVWDVYPIDKTTVADYSYVVIRNANTSSIPLYLDAQAWAMDKGANASVWSDSDASDCPPNGWQRWHLEYVGDGYYHIRNYESGLYLALDGGSTANGANVHQWVNDGSDKLLWKFVPADHAVDATAPAMPTGLVATPQSGSIKLSWTANTESDIYGYMVYRYNTAAGIWECIGRKVQGTVFLDNTCRKGQSLRYRIKAIDRAYNISAASSEVTTMTTADKALIGHWTGMSLLDNTANMLHAVQYGGVSFATDDNHASFVFDGSDDYVKLPYHVGDMKEMTFAAWVKGGSTTAWQRIFDFGNGEDEYLFLTPSNGSAMRFEIKKDGVTQGLNATTTLGTDTWKHVAVTIGSDEVAIYINGVKNASTTSITLRPSDIAPTISYIGRSQFIVDPAFKGMISNMRIYNYALTDSEVKGLASNSLSPEDIESLTLNVIAEAEALLEQPMYAVVAQALRDAVDAVEVALDNYITKLNNGTATSTDADRWSKSLENLTESDVQPNARASIEVYKTLAAQMAIAREKAETFRQETCGGIEDFGLADVEKNYYDGYYPDSQISAAVIEVKGITNRYLMADAIIFATEDNPIDVSAFIVEQAGFDNDIYAPWQASPTPAGVTWGSVEFWNTNFTFSQLLYGMPPGTYRLQTRAFYRYGYQGDNYTAHHNGTLQRNAKLYISHSEGTQTADIMAISDDPSDVHEWGNWYCDQDGKWVPDNMQAASEAIDVRGKYQPQNGYNSVEITVNEVGDLTIGAKKETLVSGDWTFFGDFSLYYLGGAKRSIKLDEEASALPRINESIEYDEVVLKRTLKAGVWNTFVSPFAIPAKMLGDWEVKALTHSSFNGEVLSLTFEDVTDGIQAGVPYMVRKDVGFTEFTMNDVQLCATLQNVTTPEGHVAFTGVYRYDFMPVGAFFINNNTFYQVKTEGKNKSKAFRAYLMPQGAAAEARALSYRTDGVVDEDDNGTSVDSATGGVTVVAIYNTQGERLTDLQDGINILQMSDGTTMKVVIK